MADIRFVFNTIGSGKSYFGTTEICKELRKTERYIVTSIPVNLVVPAKIRGVDLEVETWKDIQKLEQIPFQLWAHYRVKTPVNIPARLVFLTKEQALEHWRYLPGWGLTAEDVAKFNLEIVTYTESDGIGGAGSAINLGTTLTGAGAGFIKISIVEILA